MLRMKLRLKVPRRLRSNSCRGNEKRKAPKVLEYTAIGKGNDSKGDRDYRNQGASLYYTSKFRASMVLCVCRRHIKKSFGFSEKHGGIRIARLERRTTQRSINCFPNFWRRTGAVMGRRWTMEHTPAVRSGPVSSDSRDSVKIRSRRGNGIRGIAESGTDPANPIKTQK